MNNHKVVMLKYVVKPPEKGVQQLLPVVASFRPLHVRAQGNDVCLWGIAKAEENLGHLPRTIGVYTLPTGAPADVSGDAKYFGSAHLACGLVFHLFVEE